MALWFPWETPSSLHQCQRQRTVPAANQMSPKSVLLDDYHGETSHHWPKVLRPQAIALLTGVVPSLNDYLSQPDPPLFLRLLCPRWKSPILSVQFWHVPANDRNGPASTSTSKDKILDFLFLPGWFIWRAPQKPRKSTRCLFFSFAVLLRTSLTVTGHLDVLHRLDVIARTSQKRTGASCLVGSPQAKCVVPGPRRRWVGGNEKEEVLRVKLPERTDKAWVSPSQLIQKNIKTM